MPRRAIVPQSTPSKGLPKARSQGRVSPWEGRTVNIEQFMQGYKAAWEQRDESKFSALFALNMALTTPHGWVFSEDELKAWLMEAGFSDFNCRPLPPPMPHWLATARRP